MITYNDYIWVKVFKNGLNKICGRQRLKNLKRYGLPKHHFKFCKGCLPQILLGLFLNTLTHINTVTTTFMLYNCISNNTFVHSK